MQRTLSAFSAAATLTVLTGCSGQSGATEAVTQQSPSPAQPSASRFTSDELQAATTAITQAADEAGWVVVAVSQRPDMTGLVIEIEAGHRHPGAEEVQTLVDVPVVLREVPGPAIPRPAEVDAR
jgi:hypothetical protein